MLELKKPSKAKLLFAFLYSSEKVYEKTLKDITKEFGCIDFESDVINFTFTQYYQEEMGLDLKRQFISLRSLISPESLVDIKLFAIKLEKKYAIVKRRRINIDPGYLNDARLILSTTKDFSHRIYVGKKIFEEITLIYKNKKFQNLPWTFPDYRTRQYKAILMKIRDLYTLKRH